MIINKILICGWNNACQVVASHHMYFTSNILAQMIISQKIGATNLLQLKDPALQSHHKLYPEEKAMQDASFAQEYNGIVDINTWETNTEEEYKNCKHILGKLMPTMAIAVVKKDKNGKLMRIVELGNLDPYNWSKNECFVPVQVYLPRWNYNSSCP